MENMEDMEDIADVLVMRDIVDIEDMDDIEDMEANETKVMRDVLVRRAVSKKSIRGFPEKVIKSSNTFLIQ